MSPPRLRPRRSEGTGAEAGAAILEYVLLVALVALVAIGGLIYLGHTSASPVRQAGSVVKDMALRGSAGGNQGGAGAKSWCSSGEGGCVLQVPVGGQEVIHFWVTGGGTSPYTYSLYEASGDGTQQSAPGFLKLDSAAQEVSVEPTAASCPSGTGTSYTYNGITLSVTDHSTPPDTGQLTFAVKVLCS